MKINLKNKAFSTIELLYYIAGMGVVLLVIFYLITNMYSFYRDLTVEPRVSRVASTVIDRVIKDIRSGQSINLSESQFGVATGNITVNSKSEGANVIKKFAYDNGRITYQENSGSVDYLTPDDLSVSKFYMTHVTSAISEGVRVELELTYDLEKNPTTRKFESFVILRHSYE
jgi:hypothetical protein